MNGLSIDIDSLVLRLGMPVDPTRAEGIVNGAIGELEGLLRSHSFHNPIPVMGFSVDSLDIPSISVGEGASDIEISQAVANEIYRALIKEVGL